MSAPIASPACSVCGCSNVYARVLTVGAPPGTPAEWLCRQCDDDVARIERGDPLDEFGTEDELPW